MGRNALFLKERQISIDENRYNYFLLDCPQHEAFFGYSWAQMKRPLGGDGIFEGTPFWLFTDGPMGSSCLPGFPKSSEANASTDRGPWAVDVGQPLSEGDVAPGDGATAAAAGGGRPWGRTRDEKGRRWDEKWRWATCNCVAEMMMKSYHGIARGWWGLGRW